jgi:tetratricopeptide (TPR) repeat protein
MVADRLVFTDAAGRQLTTGDLSGFTGRVRWEIIGADRVPPEAAALHERARNLGEHGDYPGALALLDRARGLAPDWPYPVYDAAFTYLLQGDVANAEVLYAQVDAMAPRGFFTCKRTLDCLRRERAGVLFPGFTRAYMTTERLDPARRKALVQGIVARYPSFAPAWWELVALLADDDARLHAISQGLVGDPDADTMGMLLISKATILARRGNRDTAVALLGDLALSPESTLATEHLAKATLALLFGD